MGCNLNIETIFPVSHLKRMVGVWWAIGFIAFFPTLISCGLRGKIFTVKQFTIFSGVFIMSIFNKCFLGPPRCYDVKILQLLLVNKHLPLILEQSNVFFCLFVCFTVFINMCMTLPKSWFDAHHSSKCQAVHK